MILWTIQQQGAWQTAQRRGVLRSDARHQADVFREPYAWLRREMHRRIGPPPRGVQSPVWAWLQYENGSRRRPDLRRSAHLPSGSHGVLIEFSAPEDQVLLSDFELWHYVLNRWYLPQTPAEVEHDVAGEARMERSWQRIFDLDWSLEDVAVPRPEKSIQGTLWQVPLGDVRSVTPFRAR